MTDEEQAAARERLLEVMRQVDMVEEELTRLLVAKKYVEIEALGAGEGLSALEIEEAVRRTRRTLRERPKATPQLRQRTIAQSADAKRCSTTCYLWTEEGNRAEIALKFTVRESREMKPSIVIDSITRNGQGESPEFNPSRGLNVGGHRTFRPTVLAEQLRHLDAVRRHRYGSQIEAVMRKIRVYYNSACPVCNAGIKYQQGKLRDCDSAIEWIDVHARNEAVTDVAADLEFVRERLHVKDEVGNVHVGWDAFAELWSRTPGQRALARLARTPILRVLFRWLYNAFAALLYRWNRSNRRW